MILRASRAHGKYYNGEAQRHAGERMVGVEHHAAAGDVGHGKAAAVFLDLHADRDALAIAPERLDAQELRVVLAEGLLGLELQLHRLARALAFERLLERREHLAIAAVQVADLRRGRDLHAVRIGEPHAHGDHRIARYDRRRLMRSNTSAACPRGFTP